MMQLICKMLLRILGWKSFDSAAPDQKCIILGAPHTSAWDFVISWIYYKSMGGKANILVKKEFFFWPFGYFLNKMGAIPIDRSKGANVIRETIKAFNSRDYMHLAITPEGTRERTTKWKAGFHTIATQTKIPVYVSSFDWGRKELRIYEKFELSKDYKEDIKRLKDYYREKGVVGKHPERFTTDY